MIAPATNEPMRIFTPRFIAILICLAGSVHIVSALASMRDTSKSAYSAMKDRLAANTMTVMPPVKTGAQILPFLGPDARYAFCRFDTHKGPVTVSADLPGLGWTVGVYRSDGSSAYFAAAPADRVTRVHLLLVPADNRFMGLTQEARGKLSPGEAPLNVTAKEGLVVVRAPDKGLSYTAEAEAGLGRAACAPSSF